MYKNYRLFLIVFIGLVFPNFINGLVYLEKPEDFIPKKKIVACFLEYQDKFLILHRQENKAHGNTWAIPGGKLEKGETPIEGIIREVKEETGFDISKQDIALVGEYCIRHPGFDFVYYITKCTPAEHPGSVKINFDEHKGFTWVTPSDALQMNLMLDEDTCIKITYDKK